MPDYKQSKIFKIVPISYENDDYDVFYGSTIQSLTQAFAHLKRKFWNYEVNKEHYQTVNSMFEKYKPDNLEIVLVENVEYNNKEELKAKLRQYIEINKCINKIAFIPAEERN